jgi:cbb3-type cytochrome oxidase subunit 3
MSSNVDEATINPDGSATFEAPVDGATAPEEDTEPNFDEDVPFEEAAAGAVEKGTDPAIFLALGFVLFVLVYFYFHRKGKKKQMEREAFFFDMDGDKFNIKLPAAVEEYYEVKEKCLQAGWEPGKPPANAQEAANGPARILAQALLKRCIADIPLVTHIQKESAGMNKLYSQSMCSVKQWKTYQAAEAMVGAEVEEVRAEADEIEPGWSQAIWRQAMQYHNMIKSRNEMEAKAREAAALKKAEEDAKEKVSPEELAKKKEAEAEKIAQELIKEEEREKAKAKKSPKK